MNVHIKAYKKDYAGMPVFEKNTIASSMGLEGFLLAPQLFASVHMNEISVLAAIGA